MRRSRTWLLRIALLLIALEVSWLVAGNVLLRTGAVEALVQRLSKHSVIHFEGAHTWFPLRVHARGIGYEMRSNAMDVKIRASEASASLRLLPLLSRRVVLGSVDAHDLDVTVTRSPGGGKTVPTSVEAGPPMVFEKVRVHSVERFSYNDFVISGGAPTVRGSAVIRKHRPMEVRDLVIDWPDARIEVGGKAAAPRIALGFRGDVGPLDPEDEPGQGFLARLSGVVDVSGDSRKLQPLHLLLPGVPWIERLDGAGDLAVHLVVEEGQIRRGTEVNIVATDLEMRLLGFDADGSGRVTVDVIESPAGSVGEMKFAFQDFRLSRRDDPKPLASGATFTLTASARDFGFAGAADGLDIVLDVPSSPVPDVKVLSTYLPNGLGVEVVDGQAKLSCHLEVHGPDRQASGFLRVDGTDLEGRLRDLDFVVDLAFVAKLSGRHLDAFDVQLGGTGIWLQNGRFRGAEYEVEDGWWMTIAIPEGVTHLRPPTMLDAQLNLSMRDTSAVLAAFAERKKWVEHFDDLLTVRDVEGTARLDVAWPSFALRDIALEGEQFEFLAQLEMKEQRSRGLLWAELGSFRLGMERAGRKNDLKLLDSRDWYDEKHEEEWAPPER